jgi:glycosyltransferase involved in cell wall biosynthesis
MPGGIGVASKDSILLKKHIFRMLCWMPVGIFITLSSKSEFGELIRSKGLAGRVLQLGFVPHEETPRYLAAFDLLVLPSETQPNWKEQFGRVILEALSCATPVIGSDSGEIPNLVLSSGGGLVFPERNASAFADKLRTMIGDQTLRLRYAENGRQWALNYASLPAVGARMAEAIERVLRKADPKVSTCARCQFVFVIFAILCEN